MNKRVGYLQDLCNDYGDFLVAMTFKGREGDMCWSKHRSVLELWHSDYGLDFLSKVNHRQILCVEIILDYDFELKPLMKSIIKKELRKKGYEYKAYHTGSKGIHVHVIHKPLGLMSRYEREQKREEIIKLCGAEMMKKSDKCMISMEKFAPHWKSGIMPQEMVI